MEIESLNSENVSTLRYYTFDSVTPPHAAYLRQTETRMLQLKKYHMISQEYVLPIPYLCQVYHLLNLNHLEPVHSLSLKGLKIGDVSQLKATTMGGSIKFQTILDSWLRILRIWRRPIAEVELTLHKLFIDIYSNLVFPKPILQILLHFASSLTLLEDLPYLHKLASGNLLHLLKPDKASNHKTMQLFKRFIDLYGSSLRQPPSSGAVELRPVSDLP